MGAIKSMASLFTAFDRPKEKRVAYATSTGTELETAYEQCIELPRALATSDGNPINGTKSNTTKAFEKRYENATLQIHVVTTALPIG